TFLRPMAPFPKDPIDTAEILNCETLQVGFAWGTGTDTAPGWSWVLEIQRGDVPLESRPDLPEPIATVDLPCDSTFQWRVAAVSADGWQSDWSDWAKFGIGPT